MGKLKALKPAIGTLAPAVRSIPREESRRIYEQKRQDDEEWRQWYGTRRWKDLRRAILIRDMFKCQATGIMLSGRHPEPNSPVVDHIIPHRGDPTLFWDERNLRAVSKKWHDSIKQAMEKGSNASPHPDWFKPSLIPLTIVCGPPASGKSTYISARAGPSDLVIDIDMIASEMAGTHAHGWDRDTYLNPAIYRRNDIIGQLSRPSRWPAAWLIVGEPKAKWRQWWQAKLKPKQIIVLETPEAICINRVRQDPQRPHKSNEDGIVRWWFEYDRRPDDAVVRPS